MFFAIHKNIKKTRGKILCNFAAVTSWDLFSKADWWRKGLHICVFYVTYMCFKWNICVLCEIYALYANTTPTPPRRAGLKKSTCSKAAAASPSRDYCLSNCSRFWTCWFRETNLHNPTPPRRAGLKKSTCSKAAAASPCRESCLSNVEPLLNMLISGN